MGNINEIYKIGKQKFDNKEYDKAVHYLKKAAYKGHVEAIHYLAECYEDGYGVSKDLKKAVELYKKSADAGYAESQYNVAYFLFTGEGVENQDKRKSVYYLKLAVNQDHAKAKSLLGSFYLQGIGINQDHKKAVKLLKQAADAGIDTAEYILGHCYYYGKGVEKNDKTAFEYYKKSADKGCSDAQVAVEQLYRYGIGCEKDLDKGIYYLKKAIQQEDMEAFAEFGSIMVEKGEKKEALKYYREALKHKDYSCITILAKFLCIGYGTEKSYVKAKELLQSCPKDYELDTYGRGILNGLKDVVDDSQVLEVGNISELPEKIDPKIKAIRVIYEGEEDNMESLNTFVSGIYSTDEMNIIRKKVNGLLKNVEEVKDDKSNELKVFMQIYLQLINLVLKSNFSNYANYNRSNLHGIFIDKDTVCVGFAEALRNVSRCRGLDCRTIFSRTKKNGEGHAYNQIKIGNSWYFVDGMYDINEIKNGRELASCLLSKEDFESIVDMLHMYEYGDIKPSFVSYPQDEVLDMFKQVRYELGLEKENRMPSRDIILRAIESLSNEK